MRRRIVGMWIYMPRDENPRKKKRGEEPVWESQGGEEVVVGREGGKGGFYGCLRKNKELIHDVVGGVQGPIQRRRPLGARKPK